jgi:malonyl-CoA/methylmalonyl-CoA synthetase
VDHVAGQLAPHKRPRDVRFLDELPRNDMGKVQKARLTSG